MRLYAISGSLRAASVHSALLRAFKACAQGGAEIELCDLVEALPIFNPDREGEETPAAVLEFAAKVGDCDGLIIASPEYAHGIPGGLKNALDWLVSRFEIIGKPVLIVQAYQSGRGQFVHSALHEVLTTASLDVLTVESARIPLVGKSREDVEAHLTKADVQAGIRDVLAAFEAHILRSRPV